MIEIVLFSWVVATTTCAWLWIRYALSQRKIRTKARAEALAQEISFRLLATKNHPDYQWLVTKLRDALTHPNHRTHGQ